jgi:hypothetical protein
MPEKLREVVKDALKEYQESNKAQRLKHAKILQLKYPLAKHTGDTYTCPVTGLTRLKDNIADDMQRQLVNERDLKQEILAQVSCLPSYLLLVAS